MNTNKTLADVKPGGRVRLGDRLPPLPYPNYPVSKTGLQNNAYTASQMWDYARAALSAQPSPGGQDALADALVPVADEWYRLCERRFAVDRISISGQLAEAIVEAVCAARQPVGEPVGRVRTRVDGGFIAELFPGAVDRVSNLAPLYAAPAQGVDLGRFRHALLRAIGWSRRSDVTSHPEDFVVLRELLTLIDSQAVGK